MFYRGNPILQKTQLVRDHAVIPFSPETFYTSVVSVIYEVTLWLGQHPGSPVSTKSIARYRTRYGRTMTAPISSSSSNCSPAPPQKLLSLLPTVAVGTSRLVEREAVGSFLDGARDADDITAYFERIRMQASASSHKKLRTLVRRDVEPLQLDSLPANIEFIPAFQEQRNRKLA
jgi:hypothetical protein